MENKIAYEDWIKDIDLLAESQVKEKKYSLTPEQKKLIHYARNRDNPLSFSVLSQYFKDKFNMPISKTTLREYYIKFKDET